MPERRSFPWARPRYELLLLALVAVVALSPLGYGTQDQSRFCLSEALLHGNLSNDACLANSFDRSSYGGHLYSDKAPGLSALAVPAVAVLQPGAQPTWSSHLWRLWGVHVLSVGILFLLCAFLVGRVSEGLAPGFGGISLVTFALGTLVASLAGTSFEHVPAAVLGFAAFLLAWRRRSALAGLVGGAALLVEYESGLTLVVIGCYVALGGWRPLRAYLAGLIPGVVLLCAYDWAAFGAPWHLSYKYVANDYAGEQSTGFFGIGLPHLFSTAEVFAGSGGLLVTSPVLVLAVYGLVRLGRTCRAEAVVAASVTALFVLSNCGYFLPFGGASPGPRFLVAALPFLALGLGPAFASYPRLTLVASALSLIPTTVLGLTWTRGGPGPGGVWAELARVPIELGSSEFVRKLPLNVLSVIGPGRVWGAVLVAVCAAAAFAVGLRGRPWAEIRAWRLHTFDWRRSSPRVVVTGAACVCLVLAADALAFANYPHGGNPNVELVTLHTSISAPSSDADVGGEVNFTIDVTDQGTVGAGSPRLTVRLSPGMRLVGPPAYTLGSGCTGTTTLVCDLGDLGPDQRDTATVYFGVEITKPAGQELTAWATSPGEPRSNVATFPVSVGA